MRSIVAVVCVIPLGFLGACGGDESDDTADDTAADRAEGAADEALSFDADDPLAIPEPATEGIPIPDDFPAVPLPEGVMVVQADRREGETSELWELAGWYDGDPLDVAESHLAALEAAGFTEVSRSDADESLFFIVEDDEWLVSAGYFPDPVRGEGTSVGMAVTPVG